MKQFEAVTIGAALKDVMFYTDEVNVIKHKNKIPLLAMAYGSKILIDDVYINYGGGAMNVAVGLNNFGIKVAPMVHLGKDSVGKEMFAYLRAEKIDQSLLSVDKTQKTGFSVIINSIKDKEHTIFAYKGANNHLKVHSLGYFRSFWFYISSLTNPNWAEEMAMISRQTKRNAKLVWNPGALQLKEYKKMLPLLKYIEVLILNKAEAVELVSSIKKSATKQKLNDIKYLLRTLKDLGPEKVVITLGHRGVAAVDDYENFYIYPAYGLQHKIVCTVGAGDAFASGFLAGLIRWIDFDKALQLGLRNSANVLYRIGAQNGLLKIKL